MENPYEDMPDEVQAVTENGIPEGPKIRRRKGGFIWGVLLGLLLGVIAMGGGTFVAMNTLANSLQQTVVSESAGSAGGGEDGALIDTETLNKMETLMLYINTYYKDEVDLDAIRDEILHGELNGLGDPYSVYYTEEEYAELQVDTTGVYYGIGAGLTQNVDTMVVTVSKVYSGTPSEEAGLMKGDIIATVDDIEATSMELSNLVKLIRGEEGTIVHLVIYRDGEKMEFDIERRNITIPSVEGQMMDGNIGYIQISEFQSTTAEQFETIYKDLLSKGMQGVIFDVRGNPGGMLSTVVDMLDFLLPEGKLVYTEDKEGKQSVYNSDAASAEKVPAVILVDGSSASASEIFAGALKDYAYGTLLGTKTFGKGIVQSVFPLKDGSAIKITTAKYYTPNGNDIHGVGIEPDIELEYEFLGPDDATYAPEYDNQLQKALETVGEMMETDN